MRVFGLPLLDRFNAKVTRGEGDECWLWTGARIKGYGTITIPDGNGGFRKMYATHFALLMLRGIEVPTGMLVMHSCDNPPCVNPEHLSVGTDLDNVRDMIAKGRANYGGRVNGERVNTARLTADQVRDIRMAYAYGETISHLMGTYHMGRHAITDVINRKSWSHIE